ncbi:hypothetical protein NDU88_002132 [Pleurodeles waltl]|uniref:Uncharacterized protein n=1 Tax=Pleurodeles waltl TaxID=8319 RepID=A0AAV7MMA0_PLEWA|nr:hypothetical protein NDU88_002132 [Pleurodeles waltl]
MRELNTVDEGVTTNPEPTDFLPVDICSGRGRLIGGSQLGNFDGNRSARGARTRSHSDGQQLLPVREEHEELHTQP